MREVSEPACGAMSPERQTSTQRGQSQLCPDPAWCRSCDHPQNLLDANLVHGEGLTTRAPLLSPGESHATQEPSGIDQCRISRVDDGGDNGARVPFADLVELLATDVDSVSVSLSV